MHTVLVLFHFVIAIDCACILEYYCTGIGTIVRLSQCQWINTEEYGYVDYRGPMRTRIITTTKRNKTQNPVNAHLMIGITASRSLIIAVSVHDDVIKWKHFPRYWPFVRGIHRSPVNSPHKGQWRGALMFSLICARINGWVNNGEAGDLRRYRVHCDVMVMIWLRCPDKPSPAKPICLSEFSNAKL